jgi:hypothetical protein
MIAKPTKQQLLKGLARYTANERPWKEAPSKWYAQLPGEKPVPLKYLYALATNTEPASVHTNEIKAVLQDLDVSIGLLEGKDEYASELLEGGEVYTRDGLAEIFGIGDATLNTGIFKPKGYRSVWLFITKQKTSDRTQYQDEFDGEVLRMEGQTAGRTDFLLTSHQNVGDELLLFYRDSKKEHPGAGFRYEGKFKYESHAGAKPARFVLSRVRPGNFKHGEKRTWELVLEALTSLGDGVGRQEVVDWIVARYPSYNTKNDVDLYMLSVNSPTRPSYPQNSKPRRTDAGSQYDRLFKVGEGPDSTYEFYNPAVHGVWEIYPDSNAGNKKKLGVRRLVDPVIAGLKAEEEAADADGTFKAGSLEDARRRVLAQIVRRRGQPAFRKALLDAYGGSCAITGCNLALILEAAHVFPYKGAHTNVVGNGILLRTDIHTLFDLRLIAIDPDTRLILVSPDLDGTDYESLRGKTIRDAAKKSHRVSLDALKWHRAQCVW